MLMRGTQESDFDADERNTRERDHADERNTRERERDDDDDERNTRECFLCKLVPNTTRNTTRKTRPIPNTNLLRHLSLLIYSSYSLLPIYGFTISSQTLT